MERRDEKDRPLPPLLARVGGNIEVRDAQALRILDPSSPVKNSATWLKDNELVFWDTRDSNFHLLICGKF